MSRRKRPCPFGYPHDATWRCYTIYALDWIVGVWPDTWSVRPLQPVFWLMMKVERPQ